MERSCEWTDGTDGSSPLGITRGDLQDVCEERRTGWDDRAGRRLPAAADAAAAGLLRDR